MKIAKRSGGLRKGVPLSGIIGVVVLVHAVAFLVPELFKGAAADMTPEARIEQARAFAAQERYDDAVEAYTAALRQKPVLPPIWHEAERELQQTRIKAEQQKRRLAKEAEEAHAATANATSAAVVETTPAEAAATTPAPAIELPKLPDIGDF